MSSVTVEIPDDVDEELDEFLERNPHFTDAEDLLLTFLRGVIEMDEATGNIEHAAEMAERDESEQALRALQNAREANEEAELAILETFGAPMKLSEEAKQTVRESEQDFENGDYVALEDA